MSARRVGLLVALVTMAAAGWYVVVYLGRWEWNRAIVAGVIFLAAEVGLVGVVLLDRLNQVHRRLDGLEADRTSAPRPAPESMSQTLIRVREASPPAVRPFDWLGDASQGPSVFVPVLLGAGVLLSGAAWVVERIGRLTAGAALERRLARQLDSLALPPGGLLGAEPPPDPFRPAGRP